MVAKAKIIKQAGFSLIELVVVVGIIALLAGVAIPNYVKYKKSADLTGIHTVALSAIKDFNICMAENNEVANPCFNSMKDGLKGTTVTINSTSHKDSKYVFTGSVDNDDFTSICIALNEEGDLSSLSYGGATTSDKLCYSYSIPSNPISACDRNRNCSSKSCLHRTGAYTRRDECKN